MEEKGKREEEEQKRKEAPGKRRDIIRMNLCFNISFFSKIFFFLLSFVSFHLIVMVVPLSSQTLFFFLAHSGDARPPKKGFLHGARSQNQKIK